eukprot:403370484
MPCWSIAKYQCIIQFLENIAMLRDDSQKQLIKNQAKEIVQSYEGQNIQHARDMQMICKQQMCMIERQSLVDIIIFMYLGGTQQINQECEIQINKLSAQSRQLVMNFMKNSLTDETYSSEYIIAIGQIEQYIENKQIQQIREINDQEISTFLGIDSDKNIDLSNFIIQKIDTKKNVVQKLSSFFNNQKESLIKQEIQVVSDSQIQIVKIANQNNMFIPQIQLQKITKSDIQIHSASESKHVMIICSSSFNQDTKQDINTWNGLLKLQQNINITTYLLDWKCESMPRLIEKVLDFIQIASIFDTKELLQPKKAQYLARVITNLMKISRVFMPLNDIHQIFKNAKQRSKVTGKLLGISIALGNPFYGKTISLLGFSFGCQVIKSCLKVLYKLGINDRIHNVTFICGTNTLHSKSDHYKWERILHNVVRGQIKNLYSQSDVLLILYTMLEKQKSIGCTQVYDKSQQNMSNLSKIKGSDTLSCIKDENEFRLRNYDISAFIQVSNEIKSQKSLFRYSIKLYECLKLAKAYF